MRVNRHSTVTHYQRPNMTHLQEGGTGGEVSEILFFSAKSKRRPSLIYSMQIILVCLSIVARRKGVSATRRGGSNWTPISLLVGHPCKLFHTQSSLSATTSGSTEIRFSRVWPSVAAAPWVGFSASNYTWSSTTKAKSWRSKSQRAIRMIANPLTP